LKLISVGHCSFLPSNIPVLESIASFYLNSLDIPCVNDRVKLSETQSQLATKNNKPQRTQSMR